MTDITVYDPAMCCSTGICGAEVDQQLVDFAADLDWLKSEGVEVTRINLSQEPALFAENAQVKTVLEEDGVEGLPVIIAGEKMKSAGLYPTRAQLAKMAGVAMAQAAKPTEEKSSGCCGGDEKSQDTGCC